MEFVGIGLLILWMVFSIGYVVYNEYNRFSGYVYKTGYDKGISDAQGAIIGQLAAEGAKCQPFPIKVGEKTVVTLTGVDCAAKTEAAAQ